MTTTRPSSPGSRATLRDVAERAGVSVKTASRVLNDDPKVSVTTRQNVRAAMDLLRYQPDPAARSLRAGRDRTVGVIVDSVGDIFFSALAATVESELSRAGYHCLLASSNGDPQLERDTVRGLIMRRCAGIIVAPTSATSLTADDLSGTPVVFIDRVGELDGATSVVVDDFGLAKEATQHLLSYGHTQIALISAAPELATTRRRQEGFRAALAEAGVTIDEELLRLSCEDESSAFAEVKNLLELEDAATAILCTSSRLTLAVVPALHQAGRTDIALVSFGDFDMADSLQPAITVIDHSPQPIARAAVRALIEQLPPSDPATAESGVIEVPSRLIPRGSGELPAPHLRDRTTQ